MNESSAGRPTYRRTVPARATSLWVPSRTPSRYASIPPARHPAMRETKNGGARRVAEQQGKLQRHDFDDPLIGFRQVLRMEARCLDVMAHRRLHPRSTAPDGDHHPGPYLVRTLSPGVHGRNAGPVSEVGQHDSAQDLVEGKAQRPAPEDTDHGRVAHRCGPRDTQLTRCGLSTYPIQGRSRRWLSGQAPSCSRLSPGGRRAVRTAAMKSELRHTLTTNATSPITSATRLSDPWGSQ